MPPKKKSGGKSGGSGYIIDGVSTTEMSREQLEVFAHRLREEVEREREERNFFQLERDKLRTFWEICRQQLEEAKCELRNKDRNIQDDEERHQNELKVLKQKVKHLVYEHQNIISELKAENMVSLKMAEDNYNKSEDLLIHDKEELNEKLNALQVAHLNEIQELKTKHSEEISNMRSSFELQSRDLEQKYEKRMKKLRNDLTVKCRNDILEIEERKNTVLHDMTIQNDKNIDNIKQYYNDITLNNLAIINALKAELLKAREKIEGLKRVNAAAGDSEEIIRELKQNVVKMQVSASTLQKKVKNAEKDKVHLDKIKARLQTCQKEMKDLKFEYDMLLFKSEKVQVFNFEMEVQKERDELHMRFTEAILELQQKSSLRNILLQGKITALKEVLETKEAQLTDVLVNAVDPGTVHTLEKRLELDKDLLDRKNAAIHDLQFEVARLCKAHDDLLDTYESKLKQYGIPKEELGFTPMRANAKKKIPTGRGPAGLVADNP